MRRLRRDKTTAERVRRAIKGVPTAKDEKLRAGYGGAFSYYKLGEALELKAILEGGELPDYKALAGYVYFTATGEEFDPKAAIRKRDWFIGESRIYDVFLIYDPDVEKLKDLALSLDLAARTALKGVSGKPKLVFAPDEVPLDPSFWRTRQAEDHLQPAALPDLPGSGEEDEERGHRLMELKDYQRHTLDVLKDFLEQLTDMRGKAEKAREIDPDLDFDPVRKAWEKVLPGRPYVARQNGLGEPLPAFALKIPTGGGKTLLGVRAIDEVNTKYRMRQNGLVLWVMPSTQIYRQTYQALKDRDHPYRRFLDIASGNRTLILEKTSGFTPQDVKENLCVLLLMLPSANRRSKDQLRMFRDSGGFEAFFPGATTTRRHTKALRKRVPNLDAFDEGGGFFNQVKTSLGNTLRILQPLIILDEGHKAYSEGARATLEGFNPCMIIELSATPPKTANVLVEVMGTDLLKEEMIKLDLHIQNRSSADWKDTLLASAEHRDLLEKARARIRGEHQHLHPPDLPDPGRAHRQGPAQAGSCPCRRRARIPDRCSRRARGPGGDQVEPEGRPEGDRRRRRAAGSGLPDPLHHHQAGAPGGLGLLLRLRADDPDEPEFAERAHPARRADPAPALRPEDGRRTAR